MKKIEIRIKADVYSVEILSHKDIDDDICAKWADLSTRSRLKNIYFQSEFLLPALEYLDPEKSVILVFVSKIINEETRYVGFAPLIKSKSSKIIGFYGLETYLSKHSYLGNWLIDFQYEAEIYEALLLAIQKFYPFASSIFMPKVKSLAFEQSVRDCLPSKFRRATIAQQSGIRVVVSKEISSSQLIANHIGPHRLRELERSRRRLSEIGHLEYRVYRENEPSISHLVTFLDIENSGWKKESGTSMMANEYDHQFIRDVFSNFMFKGNVIVAEMLCDGQVVASSMNFLCESEGFAFKVAISEESKFKKLGVGFFAEYLFLKFFADECEEIFAFDSGAQSDSWVAKVWPGLAKLETAHIPLNAFGNIENFLRNIAAGAAPVRSRLKARLKEFTNRGPKGATRSA